MAKKKHVVIAYFPGEAEANMAAEQLKTWDRSFEEIRLGGIAVMTWQDGKIKTQKVGGRATAKGSGWGLALGAVTGILSGGVTLIGGAVAGAAGGAILGSLFYKGLGLSDEDKARLDAHLQQGGAALVLMARADEVAATRDIISSMGGKIEDFAVPDDTLEKVEVAEEITSIVDDATDDDRP